jgi:PAS domain S-box-containing protein
MIMIVDNRRVAALNQEHHNVKSVNGFLRVITSVAILAALLLAVVFLRWGGSGPVVAVLPWFVPVIGLFNALSFLLVAFLAIGRYNVLRDPASFWIGMGSAAFCVAFVFYALAWPGLLPGRGSIIASGIDAPTWFLHSGITILSIFWLTAVLARRPIGEAMAGGRLLLIAAAWTALVVVAFTLLLRTERYLPELVSSAGIYEVRLLIWNAVAASMLAAGAVLSTRRYVKTGDALLGFIAIAQIAFAFALFATLGGMRRYDLSWYLVRSIPTGSALVVMFGLLFDYVQLIRREKEKTAQVLRTERGLRESRAKLEAALASMTDAVFISDAEGRFIDFNDAFVTFHRFRNKDECSKSFTDYPDILEMFFADGTPAPTDMWAVPRALRGETATNAEYSLRRKDTGETWVGSYSFSPIRDKDGAIVGSVVVGRDITERKRAEEALWESEARFRWLADAMPQLVWTAEPDGRVDYYNVRYKEYSGIEPAPDGTFQWAPVLHAEDVEPTVRAWENAVQSGRMYQIEHRVQGVDGRYRWHLSRAIPIFDNHKRIIKWFGTATDINDVKQAEDELRRLNETLEQRVTERTELAEARSAQLQTLAVELIEAEERERRRISELLHDDLQQVLAAARLMLQSVREGLPAMPELLDVEQLLEESIDKARRLSHELSPAVLHHAGLVPALEWLGRKMHEQFGLQVQLDAAAHQLPSATLKVFLFRAAQELLYNVIKHSGVKCAHVVLSERNGATVLTVSDEGRGVDPAILSSPSVTTGVGLLSLWERANSIGGCLSIESLPGQGTRLTLTVPTQLDSTGGTVADSAAVVCDPVVRARSARNESEEILRVLFVDDHKVMRQGLIRIIANQPNIQLAGEAANGREAIELARRLRPDVIIMDIGMPELDGTEATRRIKAELPDVRVIGLSMFEDDQVASQMRAAGAEAFVSKTASSAELLKAIYGSRASVNPGL